MSKKFNEIIKGLNEAGEVCKEGRDDDEQQETIAADNKSNRNPGEVTIRRIDISFNKDE